MLVCPACGAENQIEGTDLCAQCSQPLTELSIQVPESSVEAALLRDRVQDLPVRKPIETGPTTSVGEAIQLMVEKSIGCLLITDQGKLVGIFSERDALNRLGVKAAEKHDLPISEFMTSNPVVISGEDKIAFALHRMDLGGYRHLPVVQEGRPISLISIRDVLRYITELNG